MNVTGTNNDDSLSDDISKGYGEVMDDDFNHSCNFNENTCDITNLGEDSDIQNDFLKEVTPEKNGTKM